MVFAFFIQSLGSKSCDILYYRFYTSYDNSTKNIRQDSDLTIPGSEKYTTKSNCDVTRYSKTAKLYEVSTEKKDLLQRFVVKIQMNYYMRRQQSLVPSQYDEKDSIMKGFFVERHWKEETSNAFQILVVWSAVPGLAFALACKRNENYLQAQIILNLIMNQLEKHLQFITNPVMPLTLVETVSLVVNRYLPAGQLIFLNSKLLKDFEKQLESDLFSK